MVYICVLPSEKHYFERLAQSLDFYGAMLILSEMLIGSSIIMNGTGTVPYCTRSSVSDNA
jgi:hypothetical protein